jgi:hypothetical protein
MKNVNKYLWAAMLLIAFVSIGLVSCQDDEEGIPVITNIRVVAKDSAIGGGEFGLPIAIQGTNLGSVVEVWFNDVKADLNPVYVTNSNILLYIADGGPTEVTNTITLVTASGKRVSGEFATILPLPYIAQLYNEFAKPGTENFVLGAYFFDIDKVLIGDTEVEILSKTENIIHFVMPETVGQDRVTVMGAGGTSVSSFRLNETVGNMINFDIPATGWGSDVCWGDAERINPDASPIEPVAGRYTRIKQTDLPATGYQGDWVVSTCWFDFGLEAAPATEKIFRFEAYIGEPWKAGFYNFNINTEGEGTFRYEWKPWDVDGLRESGIKTNGWMTFAIPASSFRKFENDAYVNPAVTISDISKIRDLQIMFSNGAANATKIPTHYVALDNFRMVDIAFEE